MKNGTQHLDFTDNTESKQAAWADIVDIDAELTVQPGSIQAWMKLSPNSTVTDISDVGLVLSVQRVRTDVLEIYLKTYLLCHVIYFISVNACMGTLYVKTAPFFPLCKYKKHSY